jgi:hypothetical protein
VVADAAKVLLRYLQDARSTSSGSGAFGPDDPGVSPELMTLHDHL